MTSLKLIGLTYLLVLIQQSLAAEVSPHLKRLYSNPNYEQSVAFDAPVIEPDRTLAALKQLKELIPENKNTFSGFYARSLAESSKTDDKWILNDLYGMMHSDLDSLLDISDYQNAKKCSHDEFKFLNIDRRGASLSSPERNKSWGPNIIAYIKYYKLKTIDNCEELLSKAIQGNADFDLIRGVIRSIFPNGVGSLAEYQSLNDFDVVASRLNEYFKSSISNFDEKIRKSATRKEIQSKFASIKNSCNKIDSQLEDRGFVTIVMEDKLVAEEVFKNKNLMELASGLEICDRVIKSDKFNEALVGIKYGAKEKLKNMFNKATESSLTIAK